MKRAIVTPPVLPPAALAELKHWLGITTPRDDAALSALLAAGLEMCEAFTGVVPLECGCEEILPAQSGWQALSARPVQAITLVQGVPADGSRFVLPPENYAVDLCADGGAKIMVMNPASAGRIAVRFTAGLAATWESLPEGLRHGVIRLAAHQHRMREDDGDGPVPPAAVVALWRPWKRVRLA